MTASSFVCGNDKHIHYWHAYNLASQALGIANSTIYLTTNANAAIAQGQTALAQANASFIQANAAFIVANTDVTNVSVTAGQYGNTTTIPIITIAANGRITAISNASVSGGGGGTTSGFLANTVVVANTTGYLANSTMSFATGNNTLTVANVISNKIAYANTSNIAVVYQTYNANTNSLDTVFGS